MKDDILSGDFPCGNLFYLEAPLIVRTPPPLKTLYYFAHVGWGRGGGECGGLVGWDGGGGFYPKFNTTTPMTEFLSVITCLSFYEFQNMVKANPTCERVHPSSSAAEE